jgi:hypothetical protein
MDKLNRPRGLVRYDSQQGLAKQTKRFLRPRVYVYACLGAIGLAVASFAFRRHVPFEANLLRLQGAPYVLENDGARIRNSLELHLVNKRGEPVHFTLSAEPEQALDYVIARTDLTLPSLGSQRIPVFVEGPNDRVSRKIRIRVDDGREPRTIEGPFVAPK